MKLLLTKVKGQFVASSINEKKEIVLSDEEKKKIILILICHKENGTHELIYKKRNYYILKRQFCYKRKKSRNGTIKTRTGVC